MAFFVVWGHDGWQYRRVTRSYRALPCRVDAVAFEATDTPDHPAALVYRYEMAGSPFTSSRRRTLEVVFNWDGYDTVTAADLTARAASCTCFVDPADTARAVLLTGQPEPWFGCGFLVAAITFIAGYNLVECRRELRRRAVRA